VEQAAEHATAVRLAELVASLSFATDLGRGLPMEHSIRLARIALRLADHVGASEDDRVATYYTGLLVGVYCHADANEQAMWFGDDIAVKADVYAADPESLRGWLIMLRRLGAGASGLDRVRRIAEFPLRGWAQVNRWLDTHSALQAEFATRIGLPPAVGDALRQSYERWDGKGVPNGVEGRRSRWRRGSSRSPTSSRSITTAAGSKQRERWQERAAGASSIRGSPERSASMRRSCS
jgi:hypothetical protein